MKAGAGVEAAAAAYFLKKIGGGAFQPKVFKGGWHQARTDIPDEQYCVINDLFGAVDALQLLGFFLGWLGAPGKGRALGVGEVKFTGMVTPAIKKVTYEVDLKRLILRKLNLGVADGLLKADGETIYTATDLKVGLFQPT